MAARLGNVLYWTGNIVAVLLLVAWAIASYATVMSRPDDWLPGFISTSAFLLLPAAISFGIGRACRYVLAGT